jgi:tRNA modification GTPase
MLPEVNDTIVAVASPPGHAARGIVRLSGPEALVIGDRVFRADDDRPLSEQRGFRRREGRLFVGDDLFVPAEAWIFRAPRSYTGQDCLELHTIGSPALLAIVVEAARAAGARPARPGEFTARAFLSGTMDLARAEAVAATIHARSNTQLRAARRMGEGALARQVHAWRQRLAELTALVEADIDFAEEPIEFITLDRLEREAQTLIREMDALRRDAAQAERFDVLPTILLLGRPNSGKSTLLNALSGLDRAICSAMAGTTRDFLTAPVNLGPFEAQMLDAAGLTADADELIRRAGERVLARAEHVDALCLVVDVSGPVEPGAFDCLAGARSVPCVIAANKVDLLDAPAHAQRLASLPTPGQTGIRAVCAVSGLTGHGLDELRMALARALGDHDALGEDTAVVLSSRQQSCLQAAAEAMRRVSTEAAACGQTLDRAELLAFELRAALSALDDIAGAVTTEDLLETVFSSFCIGK